MVNGEPSEERLVSGQKGAVDFDIAVIERSVHSGYPERGVDANQRLLNIARKLLDADFGTEPE